MKIFTQVFIILFLFSTCSKLDETPEGAYTLENVIRTPDDVEAVIMGAYGLIASKQLYGQDLTLLLLLRGDMCSLGDADSEEEELDNFMLDARHPYVKSIWTQAYKVISTTNSAIHGIGLLDDKDADRLIELEAEARFIRAFTYYHLVRLFGDIPYVDFFITSPEAGEIIEQISASKIYTNIILDLEFAKENLPTIQESEDEDNSRARATIGTAYAFLASVHLTLGNHQKAFEEANWIIQHRGDFDYELTDDFQDLFDEGEADGLEEHLMAFDFKGSEKGSDGENEDYLSTFTGIKDTEDHADGYGESVAVPSMKVYSSWNEEDPRREVSLTDEAEFEDDDLDYNEFDIPRPHIAKYATTEYIGKEKDGAITDNNYAAMRYAEVLLIAAEAANENGDPFTATNLINEIRARAREESDIDFPFDLEEGLSQDMLRDSILEERRLELAFEFKRWYDIKRLNIGQQVFITNNEKLEEQNFLDHHYLLPIPDSEIILSPNVLSQNPGY